LPVASCQHESFSSGNWQLATGNWQLDEPVKALVVEDNPGILATVVDLLTRRGHDVAAFGDAESAWGATRHEVYHIAVLDWGLPAMDGIELCRLILTGRVGDDIVDVVGTGADDYLTKPWSSGRSFAPSGSTAVRGTTSPGPSRTPRSTICSKVSTRWP